MTACIICLFIGAMIGVATMVILKDWKRQDAEIIDINRKKNEKQF
jgi:hypothetical protein